MGQNPDPTLSYLTPKPRLIYHSIKIPTEKPLVNHIYRERSGVAFLGEKILWFSSDRYWSTMPRFVKHFRSFTQHILLGVTLCFAVTMIVKMKMVRKKWD